MVRFAFDIMARMSDLVKDLEVVLGPDTDDLNLRIGIHSGPVTAGILRGKKARFQLFGTWGFEKGALMLVLIRASKFAP